MLPRRPDETRGLTQRGLTKRVQAEHAATGRVSAETLATVVAEMNTLNYAELHELLQLITSDGAPEAGPRRRPGHFAGRRS